MNNKILISSLVLVVIGSVLLTKVDKASAAESNSNERNPMIQALLERFNLNEEEVDTFVEERRGQMREEKRLGQEERFNKAVEEGIITEEQKNMILQKMEEQRNESANLTWEERHNNRENQREEMESWASENGIDLEALHQSLWAGGPMHKDGMRCGM